jgi:Transmembrane secretion effector
VSARLPARRLNRILASYAVNELGTWFAYVALAVVVYDQTHSALAVTALFLAMGLLPVVFVPALIARVEASERHGGVSALYLIEAATAGALALLLWHFWLPGILILVAIDGTAALAAKALVRAVAARTAVEDAQREQPPLGTSNEQSLEGAQRQATARLNIALTTTMALGPGLAGVFVALVGGPGALLVDACSFLACAALLLDVRSHVESPSVTSVRARISAAWEHMRLIRLLRTLLITEALAVVFFASILPVEIEYAKVSLHSGGVGYGLLLSAWGAGMVVGGIIFARSARRPLGPLLTGGTLAIGLAYLGFAAAPVLALACGAAALGGLGNGVQWAALISTVQRLTPQRLLGQLMGVVESINAFCPAVGFLLGGTVAALSSPRGAFLLAGILASLTTVAFFRLSMRGGPLAGAPVDGEAQAPHPTPELTPSGAIHNTALEREPERVGSDLEI